MWSFSSRAGRRPAAAGVASVLVALAVVVSACTSAPAADTPSGVVRTALDRLAAKDIPGLTALACAGQEEAIRGQLGLPLGSAGQLVPGVDTTALLDAVRLDVSKVKVGAETVTGDAASVALSGDMGVTFDPVAARPMIRKLLEAQGSKISDQQVDALLSSLATYGQAVPLNTTVDLRRENGAWKVCQAKAP